MRLPARRRPIGRSRVRPKRSPSIERTHRQEIHGNRWALVAAELPGKTGQQCAQRWRHKVNPAIKKEKWTPEEDAQVSNPASSSSIRARDLGVISSRECFLAPEAASAPRATARATEEPRGPERPPKSFPPSFSPEPSKLTDVFFGVRNSSKQPSKKPPTTDCPVSPRPSQLAKLYEQHGQRWAEIARHLEGRTDQQCMGRWRRHLDPSVKKDAWTDPEDKKLMSLHESLGPRWSNISKMLTGRTAQQCRARWFQLSAADDDALSEGTTVSAAAAGSEGGKSSGGSSGKKRPKTALKTSNLGRNPTPPISPSTPAVTDEVDGAVASGRSDLNRGTVSKKRGVGSVPAPRREEAPIRDGKRQQQGRQPERYVVERVRVRQRRGFRPARHAVQRRGYVRDERGGGADEIVSP